VDGERIEGVYSEIQLKWLCFNYKKAASFARLALLAPSWRPITENFSVIFSSP
jgi:hypothetical protein